MSTPVKRKLIEVALPLEAINREAAREKSIRHGHPSTLHLWWARRPLAACRAVLFASLVDDPSAHPDQFPTEADQEVERKRLFGIIEALVKWENSNNEDVLAAARAEILRSTDGKPPPVLDPFCGGGSIPLEAQRLGLEAHASDLNPVAVLITKALIEIPPKFAGRPPVNPDAADGKITNTWKGAQGLADDIRYYGRWVRDEAERRIGHLYPKAKLPDGSEATVIAWIWARTVTCPNPACGATMPLVRSFALSTKKGKEVWIEPIIETGAKQVRFEVRVGKGNVPTGTVDRRGARCVACGESVPLTYVRAEGQAKRIGAQLTAIVAEGERVRVFLPPDEEHEKAAASSEPMDAPDTDLPNQALGFRVQNYGMAKHRDLFTERQLAALTTFSELVGTAREHVCAGARKAGLPDGNEGLAEGGDGAVAYADAIATYLAFAVDRSADYWSSLAIWAGEFIAHTFGLQTLSMKWDFAEGNPIGSSTGGWHGAIDWIARVIERVPASGLGVVKQIDATQAVNGVDRPMVATDPPYYDNIGYADLSDFFYVWLRRSIGRVWPQIFSTLLTPKEQELIAAPERFHGDKQQAQEHFEEGLGEAFARIREAHDPRYPMTVVYGFKQQEAGAEGEVASTGWDTMLEGLLRAGFSISGTWPMRTERPGRMRESGSAALASSVILACRPRDDSAGLATRKELLAALKAELPEALRTLQHGNIAPVDLAQAAIGPGMAVFSRYATVVEADGSSMPVRTALALINEVLDELLAEQEGEFDADTRWAVAWFEQFGMNEGAYGTAETLSKAKNSAVNALVEAGIVASRAGKVRLLDRSELDAGWDPVTDLRRTVWEVTQYLIRALESEGESGAADLLRRVGLGLGEIARDLAYRLYSICERKKWAKEALAYNSLVVAWPELVRLASESSPVEEQGVLGV